MISVCIATYNGSKYITQQLNSILNQLGAEDEIIVSDNESSDETIALIKSLNDPRIKIFSYPKYYGKFPYSGITKNFENAINHSQGDLIFLADQDDVWLKDRVKKMQLAVQETDLLISNCSITDENLNIIIPSKFDTEKVSLGIIRNIIKCGFLGCCMCMHRQAIKYALPFPEDVPHDLWIATTIATKGHVSLLHESTLLYRRHDNSVSGNTTAVIRRNKRIQKNDNTLLYKIKYRSAIISAYARFLLRMNK